MYRSNPLLFKLNTSHCAKLADVRIKMPSVAVTVSGCEVGKGTKLRSGGRLMMKRQNAKMVMTLGCS
jgi:hypothetical protein